MKTIKTIGAIFLLVLISYSVLAVEGYYKGDTIRYKFDKMLIEVASANALNNSPQKLNMQERLDQILKVFEGISILPPSDEERVTISFRDQGEDMWVWNYQEIELSRTVRNQKTLIVFDDGTTFEKDYGKYCIFFSYRAIEMKIFVNDLSDLNYFLDDAFNKRTELAEALLEKKFAKNNSKGVIAWLDLRGDEVEAYFQDPVHKSTDMILLSGGIGSGWVKNLFVADINLRLGVGFGKKGIMRNIYAVDWNMMYDFSESNENKFFEMNHFVSLNWDHNFSNQIHSDKWYGFSVGYLVKRNNDFFKENTFRVAVNKKINDTFTVKPELYFNDFVKNVYPGIRVSVAF